MKYRLYENSNNNTDNVLKTVLHNRGIEDYNTYLNLDSSVEIHYSLLDNISEAVNCFASHYAQNNTIGILIDEDVDGETSAGSMFGYVRKMDSNYPVKYIMHGKAKAHGLSDDVVVPDDIKLLIIPDAATNDYKQCKLLKEKGIEIIILDHHEAENNNKFAIIVNNQLSKNYENKNLCGVGVVYKFLQALDDYYWNDYADEFLDLVALGLIGDMMDIKSYETKYLISKGLNNINNKFLEALIKAQDYSMNGIVNIHNLQWYIVPVINGMIRNGSLEEKEILFKAIIEQDEMFEYKTRASKAKGTESEIIQESIYDRAARLSKNSKARQDKIKEKCVSQLYDMVTENCSNDKVIIIDATDAIESGLTGVVAMKLAQTFNKPCVLLNKHNEKIIIHDEETNTDKTVYKEVFGGSARNINNSPIVSLKDVLNETKVFDFAQGHGNACGIKLQLDKVDEAKESLNNLLKDIVYESEYLVDFILNISDVNSYMIFDLSKLDNVIGQGIDESLIAIENIKLNRKEVEIFGKQSYTISFNINEIKYVQFKCKEGNQLYDWINDGWDTDGSITINIVGKPSINIYGNTRTPQIIIEDFMVIEIDNNAKYEEEIDEDVW